MGGCLYVLFNELVRFGAVHGREAGHQFGVSALNFRQGALLGVYCSLANRIGTNNEELAQ